MEATAGLPFLRDAGLWIGEGCLLWRLFCPSEDFDLKGAELSCRLEVP
jgi:hypothetical protein